MFDDGRGGDIIIKCLIGRMDYCLNAFEYKNYHYRVGLYRLSETLSPRRHDIEIRGLKESLASVSFPVLSQTQGPLVIAEGEVFRTNIRGS